MIQAHPTGHPAFLDCRIITFNYGLLTKEMTKMPQQSLFILTAAFCLSVAIDSSTSACVAGKLPCLVVFQTLEQFFTENIALSTSALVQYSILSASSFPKIGIGSLSTATMDDIVVQFLSIVSLELFFQLFILVGLYPLVTLNDFLFLFDMVDSSVFYLLLTFLLILV